MKIGDPVFSLFMRVNESATSLMAHSTGLSGTQFSILNVLELLIPKDLKNIKPDVKVKVNFTRTKFSANVCCKLSKLMVNRLNNTYE